MSFASCCCPKEPGVTSEDKGKDMAQDALVRNRLGGWWKVMMALCLLLPIVLYVLAVVDIRWLASVVTLVRDGIREAEALVY
jgi:hypothetical protein